MHVTPKDSAGHDHPPRKQPKVKIIAFYILPCSLRANSRLTTSFITIETSGSVVTADEAHICRVLYTPCSLSSYKVVAA